MKTFFTFSSTFILILFCCASLCFAADSESEIDQFRRSQQIDTVAKIINYTEGLDEGGSGDAFWYVYNAKDCIYRKASITEVKVVTPPVISNSEVNTVSNAVNTTITQYIFETNVKELKLNTWVPSTVLVGYVQNAGTWWGPNNYFLQVMANGTLMLESSKPRDLIRTKSAWNQIFNRFCPGTRNYF